MTTTRATPRERLLAAAAELEPERLEQLAAIAEHLAAARGTADWSPFDHRCCRLATKHTGACACSYVSRCPLHGERHVGRH